MPMIFETIMITQDLQGNVHVTPFGVQKQDDLFIISPYKPSTTLDNIIATGLAVLNLTDDVLMFASTLTGRKAWDIVCENFSTQKRDLVSLVPTTKVAGFRLSNTLAHHELTLIKVEDDVLRPKLYMQSVHQEHHRPFAGFNRAQAAVIELAVLVSRLHRLPLEKITQDMAYLQIAIDKTAGPRELEAWAWLVEAVENHKAAINLENLA